MKQPTRREGAGSLSRPFPDTIGAIPRSPRRLPSALPAPKCALPKRPEPLAGIFARHPGPDSNAPISFFAFRCVRQEGGLGGCTFLALITPSHSPPHIGPGGTTPAQAATPDGLRYLC